MMRSWAYNRFGVLMGTSWPASYPHWHGVREVSWPMITLFHSQGGFKATAVPHITSHGLFPVAARRSSAPTPRYPCRPQLPAQGLAAGPPASFDTGQYSSQSHRRTTGSGACPSTPNEAAGPTNGGQSGDGRASTKRPRRYTKAATYSRVQ